MNKTTISLFAIALGAAVALAGCNGGEDFSDAIIGGGNPIDPRPDPAPIPDDDEPAVEIELVVGIDDGGTYRTANIANINYTCTEAVGVVEDGGLKPYIARCAPTADRVEFFVGGTLTGDRRISIGTAHLPLCTGRSGGSGGQSGCAGGTGFFQVALADLIPVGINDSIGAERPLTAPARRDATDAAVRNRAAFLLALDQTPGDRVITIDPVAHNNSSLAPETNFSQTDYAAFVDYWDDWVEVQLGKDLPDDSTVAEGVAKVAVDRTRIGLYSLEHDGVTYKAAFPADSQLGTLSIVLPFIVMPDGSAGGVGALFGSTGSGASVASAVNLLALDSDSRLTDTLLLKNDGGDLWTARSVLSAANADANLDFAGRITGTSAYDNKLTSDNKTDYRLDYPATGIYIPKANDWARFEGEALDKFYDDAPYRISRTGYVGAVLNETLVSQLPDFYRITIYKACANPDDAECQLIPEAEIGPGLNYPEFIDNDNCDPRYPDRANQPTSDGGLDGGCNDNDLALDLKTQQGAYVGKEKPRGGVDYAFADGSFNIQFLADGSIITDRRGECRPLTDPVALTRDNGLGGTDTEVRVGYVSRTLQNNPDDPDDVATDSVNVLIFMTGSAESGSTIATSAVPPAVPHYGTQIQGRIDLADNTMPMRRLGDQNFEDGVRAFWQDFYQAGRLAQSFGDTEATGEDGHRIRALQGGAAEGVALDGVAGNCQPIPPAP